MKLSSLFVLASAGVGADEAVTYSSPNPTGVHFYESFDSASALDSWTLSNNEKYSKGKWAIEPLTKDAVAGDSGMVLKNKKRFWITKV